MRELALSVTNAILTINPDSWHWSYTIVNFQNCLITLDDPLGMPATILGIKQRLGIVHILQKVQSWAVSMQTARDERSRPFTFRMQVTCTQADSYQCGPRQWSRAPLYVSSKASRRRARKASSTCRLAHVMMKSSICAARRMRARSTFSFQTPLLHILLLPGRRSS